MVCHKEKKRARSVYGGNPHYFCTHSCARYTLDDEQNYGQGQMGAHPWIPSKAFQNRTRLIPRASHAKPISCQMGRIIIDTLVLPTPFHSKWEPAVPNPFGPMGPWERHRLQNSKKTSKKNVAKTETKTLKKPYGKPFKNHIKKTLKKRPERFFLTKYIAFPFNRSKHC